MEIVNKWLEGYLRNYVSGQQKVWIKWLHLGEHFYNTTYQNSIKMKPFKALYGYDSINFVDLTFAKNRAPKAKYWIQQSQDINKLSKITCKRHIINIRCKPRSIEWSVVSRWETWYTFSCGHTISHP
jgi:hypothetical protein